MMSPDDEEIIDEAVQAITDDNERAVLADSPWQIQEQIDPLVQRMRKQRSSYASLDVPNIAESKALLNLIKRRSLNERLIALDIRFQTELDELKQKYDIQRQEILKEFGD